MPVAFVRSYPVLVWERTEPGTTVSGNRIQPPAADHFARDALIQEALSLAEG
jgi:hypothetical protein